MYVPHITMLIYYDAAHYGVGKYEHPSAMVHMIEMFST